MKKFYLTLLLMVVTVTMMAVPAKKGIWKTLKLQDGTEVRAQLVGDEFGHHWRTQSGQCFISVNGVLEEETATARQNAAQRRAQAQQRRASRLPRPTANGLRRSAPASHLGEKKGLILLVNFKDTKFQTDHDQALYNNIANTPGYTDDNGFQGSVSDYFKAQSRDLFNLTFDVVGPVTVSKNAKYYGENDEGGSDMHPEDMVVEAVKLVKEKNMVSDWSQYDWDGDGEVDQVMIIYAGEGEADGGDENTIWPHEWELCYAEKDFEIVDGIKINTYAVANEGSMEGTYYSSKFQINGIGTVCHEFSHCLGLMDMYDVSYSGYYGMGEWSLMDAGSYNGNGFVPSGYTSYDKYCIGWMEPTELTAEKTVSGMRALTDADDVYIIKNAAHPDEYYLLENRQRKGWDAKVPTDGMLILHVDYDPQIWAYNLINSNSDGSEGYPVNDHQRCTIFHADGIDKTGELYAKMQEAVENYYATYDEKYLDEYYDLSDQYDADVQADVYPQANNNQLTNTSTPRAFTYNANSDGRKLMNIAITDITQNADGTISFKFAPDATGTEEGDNTDYGQGGNNNGGPEYEKVTSASQLVSGSAYVLVNESNEAGNGAFDSKYLSAVSVTINGDVASGKGLAPITLGGNANGYSLQIDGKYLYTEAAKTLKVATAEKKDWLIEATSDGYVVKAKNSKYGTIQYNSGTPRFLNYATTQKPAVLYVQKAATALQTINTNKTTTTRIYTIDGRYVGTDPNLLPRGLYIINGKKIVK